ncbi:MAG: ATP phosphoribosyltransferase regulatory subunit [Acidobacteria bacterium 13_1_20CM_3_53_8]|nr:MAG: ATP phosphoribosyltransferase regulatory subunit [Acidobacteria bacterium 13_1_20CM_3_53_8]
MRYYFGAEARLRRAVENTAMSVFDGWSYEEVTTPSVDYYALFERGMGHSEAHRSFRLTDTDGRLLALRPDVTSSAARAAATLFAERARPLRLCYAANVFRQQPRSHAEWRRESTQLGCELIGAGGATADIEVLLIAAEILQKLNLSDFCITLSSVEVFNGVAASLNFDETKRAEMQRLIDMKDATELQKFLAPYAPPGEIAAFARLTRLSGKSRVIDEAREVITNARSVAALRELENLWRVIESLDLTELFEIDLGDVSGLDYYTGLIFKIYLSGAGGRVGRGGRYDNLTENFGRAEPAIGFVLDLDAITDVLARGGFNFAQDSESGVTILGSDDDASLFLKAKEQRARDEKIKISDK